MPINFFGWMSAWPKEVGRKLNVIEDEDGGAGELSVVKLKEAEKREGENINRTSPIQSGPTPCPNIRCHRILSEMSNRIPKEEKICLKLCLCTLEIINKAHVPKEQPPMSNAAIVGHGGGGIGGLNEAQFGTWGHHNGCVH